MRTALVWFLLSAVPILGSLIDYHKNERPKKKQQILLEINTNDTLNIENNGKDRTNR
tara:strand:+ start:836 stop:1006 length:171 start_codon:yes stop_codon:yes gene_type:complete